MVAKEQTPKPGVIDVKVDPPPVVKELDQGAGTGKALAIIRRLIKASGRRRLQQVLDPLLDEPDAVPAGQSSDESSKKP